MKQQTSMYPDVCCVLCTSFQQNCHVTGDASFNVAVGLRVFRGGTEVSNLKVADAKVVELEHRKGEPYLFDGNCGVAHVVGRWVGVENLEQLQVRKREKQRSMGPSHWSAVAPVKHVLYWRLQSRVLPQRNCRNALHCGKCKQMIYSLGNWSACSKLR